MRNYLFIIQTKPPARLLPPLVPAKDTGRDENWFAELFYKDGGLLPKISISPDGMDRDTGRWTRTGQLPKYFTTEGAMLTTGAGNWALPVFTIKHLSIHLQWSSVTFRIVNKWRRNNSPKILYKFANHLLTACYLVVNCLLTACYPIATCLLTASFCLCVIIKFRSTEEQVWRACYSRSSSLSSLSFLYPSWHLEVLYKLFQVFLDTECLYIYKWPCLSVGLSVGLY